MINRNRDEEVLRRSRWDEIGHAMREVKYSDKIRDGGHFG